MSLSDIYLAVQLFSPDLSSFLLTKNLLNTFNEVSAFFLCGVLISKLLAIIFSSFLVNLWFVSNNSISDSVDFSCGFTIPLFLAKFYNFTLNFKVCQFFILCRKDLKIKILKSFLKYCELNNQYNPSKKVVLLIQFDLHHIFYFFIFSDFLSGIYKVMEKIQKLTYFQKNSDAILQRSKEYYENNKDEGEKYQRDRFHNKTSEKRDKLNEYRRAWYNKLDEENKNQIRKDARNRYYDGV